MRNRELINIKLEQLDGKLKTLRFLATEGKDIQNYFTTIESSEGLIEEVKSLISNQDFTPDEMNRV